jgi:hypothetical protein
VSPVRKGTGVAAVTGGAGVRKAAAADSRPASLARAQGLVQIRRLIPAANTWAGAGAERSDRPWSSFSRVERLWRTQIRSGSCPGTFPNKRDGKSRAGKRT